MNNGDVDKIPFDNMAEEDADSTSPAIEQEGQEEEEDSKPAAIIRDEQQEQQEIGAATEPPHLEEQQPQQPVTSPPQLALESPAREQIKAILFGRNSLGARHSLGARSADETTQQQQQQQQQHAGTAARSAVRTRITAKKATGGTKAPAKQRPEPRGGLLGLAKETKKTKKRANVQDIDDRPNAAAKKTTATKTSAEVFSCVPDEPIGIDWTGWTKKTFQRQSGMSVGATDSYWYTPKTQKKLRSLKEVARFMDYMAQVNFDEDAAFRKLKGR